MNARSLLALALLSLALPARAEELVEPSSGQRFERTPTIDGKPYLCLGSGMRKKAFFKVYAIVFCVEDGAGRAGLEQYFAGPGRVYASMSGEKLARRLEDDPAFFQMLVAMPVAKAARLVFVRDVGRQRMADAFAESLTRVLGKGEQARIGALVKLLDRDIRSGDQLVLRTWPNGELQVGLEGELKQLEDPVLAMAIWQAYLGPGSVVGSLKRSIAEGAAALRK